jgi:hypothetical protein
MDQFLYVKFSIGRGTYASLVKGTQACYSFEFFWHKSKPYMPLVNFRRKNSIIFLRFLQEFQCSNIFAVTDNLLSRGSWIFFVVNVNFGIILNLIYELGKISSNTRINHPQLSEISSTNSAKCHSHSASIILNLAKSHPHSAKSHPWTL